MADQNQIFKSSKKLESTNLLIVPDE